MFVQYEQQLTAHENLNLVPKILTSPYVNV